jgi:hypothetical protein
MKLTMDQVRDTLTKRYEELRNAPIKNLDDISTKEQWHTLQKIFNEYPWMLEDSGCLYYWDYEHECPFSTASVQELIAEDYDFPEDWIVHIEYSPKMIAI